MTDTVSTAEARRLFSDLVSRVSYGKERIVVTRHHKHAVAIVPLEDLELLELLEDRVDLQAVVSVLADENDETLDWQRVKDLLS